MTVKNPNSTRKKCDVLISTLRDAKNGYVPVMGTTASERHDDINNVYKSDAEAKNKSTMIEKHYEEPVADVDNTEADEGTDTTTVPHAKPNTPSSNRSSNSCYACSNLDIASPTSIKNIDQVYASLPQVTITTHGQEAVRERALVTQGQDSKSGGQGKEITRGTYRTGKVAFPKLTTGTTETQEDLLPAATTRPT